MPLTLAENIKKHPKKRRALIISAIMSDDKEIPSVFEQAEDGVKSMILTMIIRLNKIKMLATLWDPSQLEVSQSVKDAALERAIRKGKKEAIAILLEKGADASLVSPNDPFIVAIMDGRIFDAETMINEMHEINYKLLNVAISYNQPYLLNIMLDKRPSQVDKDTALHFAITRHYNYKTTLGALEAAATLMAEGARPTERDLVHMSKSKFGRISIDLDVAKLVMPNLSNITPKAAEIITQDPRILEAILTGTIAVNGSVYSTLIEATPASSLVVIAERHPKLRENMLNGIIKINQVQLEALLEAAPTAELRGIINKDKPIFDINKLSSAQPERLNDALAHAVLSGNVKKAQELILYGASVVGIIGKDGTELGMTLADYMKYGAEKAAEQGKKYDKKGMETLISSYEAAEKQFKDRFEAKVITSIKNLGTEAPAEDVAKVFNTALADAYKPGYADKVKPVIVATIVEDCKLDFVDKFFIAIKSLVSEKTFDELESLKLADRVFKEIHNTRAFQEMASPEIGKTAAAKSHVAGLAPNAQSEGKTR